MTVNELKNLIFSHSQLVLANRATKEECAQLQNKSCQTFFQAFSPSEKQVFVNHLSICPWCYDYYKDLTGDCELKEARAAIDSSKKQ